MLAQDGIVVYDVAERYPRALNVFRICGDVFDFQSPPQVNGVVDLVVVLSERYAKLARACAVDVPLARLRIPVDIHRLAPVGTIRARPRRAVILGNYPDRIQIVREAWERRGIEVSQVGASQQRFDIAAALESADIVVGKSRAAVDAMACGRAVYVYDMFGGDGWVTPHTYAAMEADHFAGQATDCVIGVEEMERDLADYDPSMGAVNRDLVIQHHDARDHVIELLSALVSPPKQRPAVPLRELSRLTALQWSWERFAREGQHAQTSLHERLVSTEQAAAASAAAASAERHRAEVLEGVAGETARLRADLETIHASRAWRLVARYWRWRDRVLRR